jgi:hypothetical protein
VIAERLSGLVGAGDGTLAGRAFASVVETSSGIAVVLDKKWFKLCPPIVTTPLVSRAHQC